MFIAKNLEKKIEDRSLWNGLEITIQGGDRIALRGPSGSGKTLLMRTLSALDEPVQGDIEFEGKPLSEWHLPEYRRRVRYVPQDASFVSGTVRKSIELFFSFRANRSLKLDEQRLQDYMNLLQLEPSFLNKTAENLSGGEKQLSALLRSLLLEPQILLLDEPTSNLDEEKVERVEKLIDDWMNSRSSHSFIWTSHDSRQLDRMTRQTIQL
ncbi:ATP-binding cassette domain-containing protein [Balneolaceae bacterium ANBcel3]|nr:ATP-binding cassette domain-containing protein [Balneolaceae bacterium ANBcel3]